jgi:N-acetylmuramoyl-L-alanine amidase
MRHHRARSLHVLVLAPVAAIFAGVLGPTPHALASATKAPTPIVITVDPGAGGRPTAADPRIPLDPGAIGVNGLQEKTVDLDVGLRLAALLRADLVNVVMTRATDVYVASAQRVQLSIERHATLVVSIHANTSSDATTDGSMVVYPNVASAALAQSLDDALSAQITGDGVPDDGFALDRFALGDAAWLQSPVPVATVEMGYLSNPTEAALMVTSGFRQDVAIGLRNGIEAYMPAIVARRNAIIAWRSAHQGTGTQGSLTPASAALAGTDGFQFGPVIAWLVGLSFVGLLLLFRDAVARVLVVVIALIGRLFSAIMRARRAAIRRRRRRQRPHAYLAAADIGSGSSRRSSVYDDIPM